MKTALFALIAVVLIIVVALSRSFISPVDVLTGKERIVGKQQLPNGDRIEIVQYWNHGDFYNLDLRHTTEAGAQYECVIDPDCNRIPRCQVEVDAVRGEAIVTAGAGIWARYKWTSRELFRKNGLLIQADPVR